MSTGIKCAAGETLTHYTMPINRSGRWCSCHGDAGGQLLCDGTEDNSVCLLGCEECYTMLKEKKEKNAETQASLQTVVRAYKVEKKIAEDLQEALKAEKDGAEEARKQALEAKETAETAATVIMNLQEQLETAKDSTSRHQQALESARQEILDLKKELENAKQSAVESQNLLIETQTKLAEAENKLQLREVTQKAEYNSLAGSKNYVQLFRSPIVSVLLQHHKAGPTGTITYNLHLSRLAQVSTYFDKWARSELSINNRLPTCYESNVDHPLAFKHFVEYLYSGTYYISDPSHKNIACLLHTLIYFLSDRLGAKTLKDMSFNNLEKSLEGDGDDGDSVVEDKVVVKMAEAIYEGLEETNDSNDDDEEDELITPLSITDESNNAGPGCVVLFQKDTVGKGEVEKVVHVDVFPTIGEGEDSEVMDCLDLDDSSDSAEGVADREEIHPLRRLVSRFAAKRLEALNKRADFRALLRRFPEFTVDMMLAKEAL